MNDRTAGAVLLIIGVVAIFAAIVGGGIKIQQIEVGSVQSKWRQWLLGAFGLVIGFVGLMMVLPDTKPADTATNTEVADENEAGTDDATAPGPDQNVSGTEDNAAPTDDNSVAVPADDTASDNGEGGQAQ